MIAATVAVVATLLATVVAAPTAAASHGFEIIRTAAGNGEPAFSGDGGLATDAALNGPSDVAIDDAGNYYIADANNNRVRKVDADGVITTVAGDGTTGQCRPIVDPGCNPFGPPTDVGDGGFALEAQLNRPAGVALDPTGTSLYIAESGGSRVRVVNLSTGTITTVAGTGAAGGGGDGGPATEAQLNRPSGIVLDSGGNLYIADSGNGRVRRVDAETGIITTVAGDGTNLTSPDEGPDVGDGGPATEAKVRNPQDVDVDAAGDLFIAAEERIRKVDAATGIITTVAGTGEPGFSGDGGPATQAQLNLPSGVVVDDAGDLFIADSRNHRVRKVGAATGIITTVAGTGEPGFSGDGGPPAEARLNFPRGVQVDERLGLLIADTNNNRVRQVLAVPDLLAVTKTDAPDPINVGQELTYVITVDNNGTETATGATVRDTLPAEVAFVSATATQGSCSETQGTVSCELGELAPDAIATITLVVAPNTPGTISNSVTASADQADPFSGNDSAVSETRVGAVGCGQVVTTSTQLTEDLGPCPANGLIIGKDNVTLDLGGHRVFGFEGPGDGTSAGIRLPARNRVEVRNGTVSGFDAGVVINGGRGNTVRGLEVRDNVGPDDPFNSELGDGIVIFDSPNNRILDNLVVGNGIFDGIGVLGADADGNLIQRNTVEGTIGPSDGGPAGQGIIVNGASEADSATIISGTRTLDNIVRGSASAGLANINNTGARIERNVVEDNGLTNAQGNGIGVQMGLIGISIPSQVLVKDNEVHGNGQDGIQVSSRENRIIDNDAADNGARFTSSYDLRDTNRAPVTRVPDCDDNLWRGNIWGSGFYAPECVTAGGSGPMPPPVMEGPVFSPTCRDGLDNDHDGLIDGDDAGCVPAGSLMSGPTLLPDDAAAGAATMDDEPPVLPTRRAPALIEG